MKNNNVSTAYSQLDNGRFTKYVPVSTSCKEDEYLFHSKSSSPEVGSQFWFYFSLIWIIKCMTFLVHNFILPNILRSQVVRDEDTLYVQHHSTHSLGPNIKQDLRQSKSNSIPT